MTPDLVAIVTRSSEQLGELIDALDTDGVAYARAYAEHILTTNRGKAVPHRPPGLPPEAGKIIREMVMESAICVRTRSTA